MSVSFFHAVFLSSIGISRSVRSKHTGNAKGYKIEEKEGPLNNTYLRKHTSLERRHENKTPVAE